MEDQPRARAWIEDLGIHNSVVLLPRLEPHDMGVLFRRADVTVSPSEHDGTPNTLLEAMACEAFPVAGDIESVREWIVDGENGLLIDPAQPRELAEAVNAVLSDPEFRARAAAQNVRQVRERAEHTVIMEQAEALYRGLIK